MENSYELLNQVNEFYNSAWEKLITIGSIAFAIVGIIVPLIIQWYQKKQLKISEENLEKKFKNEVASVKETIKEEINDILKEEIKLFELKMKKIENSSNAKILHLQGRKSADSSNFKDALVDFLLSAKLYSKADEYGNLQVMLDMIELALEKITPEEYIDIKLSAKYEFKEILEEIKVADEKKAFDRIIARINLKLTKLDK